MVRFRFAPVLLASLIPGLVGPVFAAVAPPASVRGERALLGKAYAPPLIALSSYEDAWKHWGVDRKPADFDARLRERYGLHPAPYPNGGYPMGVRPSEFSLGFIKRKGLSVDCMLCHGGSIAGKSYVGLGNATLDSQAFHEELLSPDGRKVKLPFRFTNVRGTNEAGAASVYLLGFRQPDLSYRLTWRDLGLNDDLCEDVPAWWLLKKKKTMYYTGGMDTRSSRSLMQFMMGALNTPGTIHDAEGDFADIRAYLLSLEAPRYPLPIDAKKAARGHDVFASTCKRCHGTYGEKWTYPNKVIPLEEIGTDRRRYDGVTTKFGHAYDKSWFAEKYPSIYTDGYQAPPLDGIWATAPYLHNGSVPTLAHLLDSKTRPKVFTRSFRTDLDAYDAARVGWKVRVLDRAPEEGKVPAIEFRKVYDTTKPGRGNGGHTYGDKLSAEEREAVIEYLKTL